MVEFNKVTKIYDSLISAVYDVSFKIEEGEFVFLIGPSGSGKTTIIKMLIRDEVPSDGRIFFNDVDITKVNRNKVYKLRREIGVVFQDFKLVPDKTAYENVAFAMEAAGKKNKEIRETVPYVLDIVGLSNRMKAFPRQLSGGEQQRVAIARAIANNPKILIADEPTGNLDPASSWDIVQVLTKINNWGTTVIMSTHGTDIVNSLNKRVIQMEKGRVIRDDNKGQYELVQAYEDETLKNVDKSESRPKEAKKKTFQVKIKKDIEQESGYMAENPSSTLISPESEIPGVKKQGSFSRLFSVFKKHKDRDENIHQTIIKALANEAVEDEPPVIKELETEPEAPKSDKMEVEEKPVARTEKTTDKEPQTESEKPEKMKFDLRSTAKMARSLKEDQSKVNAQTEDSKPVEEEHEYTEALNNAEKISIDDMNLPKSVKGDLKSAGFKTAQDIINAGPDELAKNLVIDPEEVILISKEIKKLVEQK